MNSLILKAKYFAMGAHAAVGQKRKFTNEPYIVHPEAVANTSLCACFLDPDLPAIVAAAWLHDVVEDTKATNEDIRKEFGDEIAKYVAEVTNVSKPSDGNRAARKKLDLEHLSNASYGGKTIKLADLIDNTRSIVKYDPEFAKVYMAEKRELLKVLKDGNAELWKQANELVEAYYKEVNYGQNQ